MPPAGNAATAAAAAAVIVPPSPVPKNNSSLHLPDAPSTSAASSLVSLIPPPPVPIQPQQESETLLMPSGASLTLYQWETTNTSGSGENIIDLSPTMSSENNIMSIQQVLLTLGLTQLCPVFEREDISVDVLCDMSHEDLRAVGVSAYGHRHKLIKAAQRIRQHSASSLSSSVGSGTLLISLPLEDREFVAVEEEMQKTIREHRDNGHAGGVFCKFNVVTVQKIRNARLWERYKRRREEVSEDCGGLPNERMLFHGSPFISAIVQKGFDERHAYIGGMFGAGIYFAEHSSKSNQYVYGIGGGSGCPQHKDRSCYSCFRQIVLCRVTLGRSFMQYAALKVGSFIFLLYFF